MSIPDAIHLIADGLGRKAYEAAWRPAQQGDILIYQEAFSRTPISLHDWLPGFAEEMVPVGKMHEVVGEIDDVIVDAETGLPIEKMWGNAYLKSVYGAELVVYSTVRSYVISEHEGTDTSAKRIRACLVEAIGLYLGHRSKGIPGAEVVAKLHKLADDLWSITPEHTQGLLSSRYRGAPLLFGWPAPEWENEAMHSYVRCALAGGKSKGKHFKGLPPHWEVPSWKPKEGMD